MTWGYTAGSFSSGPEGPWEGSVAGEDTGQPWALTPRGRREGLGYRRTLTPGQQRTDSWSGAWGTTGTEDVLRRSGKDGCRWHRSGAFCASG